MRTLLSPLLSSLLAVFTLSVSSAASALVDPMPTTMPVPGWLAEIKVAGRPIVFCSGVLIAPQWVLSATSCMLDPYRQISGISDEDMQVRLGPNGDVVDIAEVYRDAATGLSFFKLALTVEAAPLPISTRKSKDLLDSDVVMFSKQASAGLQHEFFNPDSNSPKAVCRVGGLDFINADGLCYLLSQPKVSNFVFQTSATVIDPTSPTAPSTALDKAVRLNTTGRQLYLDFRKQKSYPCNEDLGLPVLSKTAAGGYEVAGIVTRAGWAAGLRICGMSFANEFLSAELIQSTMALMTARVELDALCPATPKLEVRYEGNTGVLLRWKPVAKAKGYRIHYTDKHGTNAISTVDLKQTTSLAPQLQKGVDYLVAITAYHDECTSELSSPEPVYLAP